MLSVNALSYKLKLVSLFICCFCIQQFSFALSPPVTGLLIPETFVSGDTLQLSLYAGDAANPFEATDSLHLIFPYSGFSILESSPISLSLQNSCFGSESEITSSFWIDTQAAEIHVILLRSPGDLISSNGLVVRLDDIIILVDDIQSRWGSSLPAKQAEVQVFFHSGGSGFGMNCLQARHISEVTLMNIKGQVVMHDYLQAGSVYLNYSQGLPPGIYYLQLKSGSFEALKTCMIR